MTVRHRPTPVLAEEVVIGVEDKCAIADPSEFLSEDNDKNNSLSENEEEPENTEETERTKEEVPKEPQYEDEKLPDEEAPDENLPDEEKPTEEPSEENPSDEENPDEENPDDGDEIFLGEETVDKLREDTVSPAEDKETNHKDNSNNSQKHNSQKHYTNNTYRNLPKTGEAENLIIWKINMLLCAAGTILLIIFAYHFALK
jgi:type IV secretory pathway VirB10-like protein